MAADGGRKEKRSQPKSLLKRFDWSSFLLTLPMWLVIIFMVVVPIILTFKTAFSSATFIGVSAKFVGLQQFRKVFADSLFWDSLKRSAVWVIGNAVLQTVVAFTCALLVDRMKRGTVFQIVILTPWVIPTVSVALIGTWLMNSNYGIVNYILLKSGLLKTPINAFGDPSKALFSLILLNCWRFFPFFFVVILGALKTVPHELYEAAAIDGASALGTFRHVTLPLVNRVIGLVGLIGMMWSFNVFDTIYLITKGGPADSTLTAPIYIYHRAFNQFQVGQSAAASVIVMFILLTFASVFYWLIGRQTRRQSG